MVAVRQTAPPSSTPASPPPTATLALPGAARTLTAAQVRAIRAAMQTFVEEDLAFGPGRSAHRWCVRCKVERPAAGFIAYECGDFCNACATAYELSRARGLIWSPHDFLTE